MKKTIIINGFPVDVEINPAEGLFPFEAKTDGVGLKGVVTIFSGGISVQNALEKAEADFHCFRLKPLQSPINPQTVEQPSP